MKQENGEEVSNDGNHEKFGIGEYSEMRSLGDNDNGVKGTTGETYRNRENRRHPSTGERRPRLCPGGRGAKPHRDCMHAGQRRSKSEVGGG